MIPIEIPKKVENWSPLGGALLFWLKTCLRSALTRGGRPPRRRVATSRHTAILRSQCRYSGYTRLLHVNFKIINVNFYQFRTIHPREIYKINMWINECRVENIDHVLTCLRSEEMTACLMLRGFAQAESVAERRATHQPDSELLSPWWSSIINCYKHAQTLKISTLFNVARLGAGRERGREARYAPPGLRVAFSLIRVQLL